MGNVLLDIRPYLVIASYILDFVLFATFAVMIIIGSRLWVKKMKEEE